MTNKEKLRKLSEIMGVEESTIILDPNSFDIEEIYVDATQTHHYKVVLRGGTVVAEKHIEKQKKS